MKITTYISSLSQVGGFDGEIRLRSVEVYLPRTDRWHEVAPMHSPRSNFGISVVDDRIFVVGGFNGVSTTNEVEAYSLQHDTWTRVCDMALLRSALDCCVISGLPNMDEYTVARDVLPLMNFDEEESDEQDLS